MQEEMDEMSRYSSNRALPTHPPTHPPSFLYLPMRWARPSTMAVFPTPGSPMSTGLFLVRRERTWLNGWVGRWVG